MKQAQRVLLPVLLFVLLIGFLPGSGRCCIGLTTQIGRSGLANHWSGYRLPVPALKSVRGHFLGLR